MQAAKRFARSLFRLGKRFKRLKWKFVWQALPELGITGSIKLLLAQLLKRRFSIRPKRYAFPLVVRGVTSDVTAFFSIICRQDYQLPRDAMIETVIDAGANAGYACVYFAHHFPNALIFAVEPEDSNYRLLVENTTHYSNISTLNGAITAEPTKMYLANPRSTKKWAFQFRDTPGEGSDPPVDGITIPMIMNRYSLSRIDMLKIDIEGGEKDLFSRNTTWLAQVNYIFIEIHAGCWKTVLDTISKYEFDCRISREYLKIKLEHNAAVEIRTGASLSNEEV
ncbi:MAG: FkbM family methyltransferase [Chloroflexota bacterium]